MKRIKIFSISLLVVIALCISGCSKFLDETPLSFTSAKTFYKTEAEAQSALNACYIKLNNIYDGVNGGLICATEYTSDLAYLNAGSVDQTFAISAGNPGFGANIWSNAYNAIMTCNATIAGIQNSTTIPEAKKPALIGEAATLRAMYYYILTSMFGDVPFYTRDASASFDVLVQVAQLGRMPAAATRDSLIADLQKWAPGLSQAKSSAISNNRVGAAVAYMLIGKMALWNKEWDVCIGAMQKLKGIYGDLSQYPLTDTWFRNKNKPESIFEIQFSGILKTSTTATQLEPPRATGTAVYDGVTVTELGSTATVYTAVTPTNYFMSLYDTTDPRRNTNLAYTYNGTWFTRPASNNHTGKPWPGPKFWCPNMSLAQDNNNQKVFRYADALLMLAEAANETGDQATAMDAINQVKARAKASFVLVNYPGHDAFLTELKKERARELFGEHGRKWDLVRWGDFYNAVSATSAIEIPIIGTNLRPYHEYYPIPQAEIDRSNGVLKNDAYNQ
ncbi:RagB/SusD family nutrient uptake outer membrane protein [Chitinophagaceae bacterium 26-R-25]|nr:RagB/SusD family nutrient uptake outer membrane protein [Chitinophagaceae bacterium 26-R-25]